VVGVAAVNGEKMDVPEGLAGVLELMSEFTYDEWNELETKMLPKAAQEKLAELAKNSQISPGSGTASS